MFHKNHVISVLLFPLIRMLNKLFTRFYLQKLKARGLPIWNIHFITFVVNDYLIVKIQHIYMHITAILINLDTWLYLRNQCILILCQCTLCGGLCNMYPIIKFTRRTLTLSYYVDTNFIWYLIYTVHSMFNKSSKNLILWIVQFKF